MAGFGFNETHEMFRKEVRLFAQKELAPGAKERAKLESISPEIIKKVAVAGFTGLNIPEKYGGQPADWITRGIAIEELARVSPETTTVINDPVRAFLILQNASEELRQEWIPPMIKGEKLACLAVTEPECGSDAAAISTRAIRDGDSYILSGEKTSISKGMQAAFAWMFAKTGPRDKVGGVSCFLVPLDLPGISRSAIPHMGMKPSGAASIIMDEVRVPAKSRIGEEGRGFYMLMGVFDFLRASGGLNCLAQAQASLDEAIAYAKQRTAFGQPIARYEGISFKIAEDAALIEAARLLCYRTFWLKDQGIRHTKESAMCKWLCPKLAVRVIHDALLIHGHVGYSEEYPIEQRLRDVIGLEIGDGTGEIMKSVIAREIMGRV